MRKLEIPATLLVVMLSVSSAAGQEARETRDTQRCVDSLDDATVARWLPRAEGDVRRVARRGQAWLLSWTVVNAAFLGAGIALARNPDDQFEREASIWAAAGTGLSLAMLYAPPISTVYAPRRLRRVRDPRERLETAVALLESGAHFESNATAAYWHVVNGVYVVGESLVLGLRNRDDVGLVILNGALSFAITETQLLTTPRAARRAVRDLEHDGYPCADEATAPAHASSSRVRLQLAGLGVFGTF